MIIDSRSFIGALKNTMPPWKKPFLREKPKDRKAQEKALFIYFKLT